MQPNIPLGEKHHHTTLKVENNQIRRRPTSRSLLKLLIFDLYLQLLSRGRTFPLTSSETDGSIVEKSREKVEPVSTFFFSPFFPFLYFPFFSLPIKFFGLKSSGMSSFATCHPPIGSLGFPYHLIHIPWISLQSCVVTCLLWVPLYLFV